MKTNTHIDIRKSIFDTSIKDRFLNNPNEIEYDENKCEINFGKNYKDFVNNNKTMLWHVRMGYESLGYLKKLKVISRKYIDLNDVKFDKKIVEREIRKFNKLPFKIYTYKNK